MNQADTMFQAGFASLQAILGETLTFRSKDVRCNVERIEEKVDEHGQPSFSGRKACRIMLRRDALGTLPLVGESFTDGTNVFRVQEKPWERGLLLECVCIVSQEPT